jgi:hypothetical protein
MFDKFSSKKPSQNNKTTPKKSISPFPSPKKLDPSSTKLAKSINEIMRRLRVLEERYTNLRKKNQLTDQNMLEDTKNMSDEIKVIQSTMTELKKEISEVNNKMKKLEEEISQSVSKREIKLLSKYLDLWQPLEFIRKEEAKHIIENVIEEIKTNQKLYKQQSQ